MRTDGLLDSDQPHPLHTRMPASADDDVVVHGNADRMALRATLLTLRPELIEARFGSNFMERQIVGLGRHHHRVT